MNSISDVLIHQIALTKINGVGNATARNLLQIFGEPKNILKASRKELLTIRGISHKIIDEILNSETLKKAEKEVEFVLQNNIQTLFIDEPSYPQRLRECSDAPILLYYRGNANLNTTKVISIVGTRNASPYGIQFCKNFLSELSAIVPDLLVVSGLAYGIDIKAHRTALEYNINTVGVLAHGLDRIYPSSHQQTAKQMLNLGGLLTEFGNNTEPNKYNFVRRNRIVAGITDAVIVVESGMKGGSLITADLASSYCRDVFAVPGKITDQQSAGCNKLISDHKADLLYSTEYFLNQMGWDQQEQIKTPKEQTLILELTDDEQNIVNILKEQQNGIHIDNLAHRSNIAVYKLFSILLNMEIKGLVKNHPGNIYSLN